MKPRFFINSSTGITHINGKHYVEIWRGIKPWLSFDFGDNLFAAIDFCRQLNGGDPEWSKGIPGRYEGSLYYQMDLKVLR